MCLSKWVMVITAICLVTLSGCSHTASPVESAIGESVQPVGDKGGNGHSLLGLYKFVCRPKTNTVEVIPLRNADLHLNALKFLEPPAFLYLTIEGQPEFNGNILNVDIGLRHPFPDQDVYTGFDVCGIMFTHGSITGFNDPDVVIAGEEDTRLLNADGYTRWWNPTEFPHGETIYNYIDGLFGNPADTADFNCTVNGYKYFADGLEKDDPLTVLTPEQRGVFSAGAKNVRQYVIDLSGDLVFNYAVDACWKFPQGEPPYDVPDDFPPGANRPEAWNISVTEVTNSLHYSGPTCTGGGELKLLIDVWDHFDAGSNIVHGESLAGLPFTTALTPVGGGEGFSTYELDFTGEDLVQSGDANILITVESDTTGYGSVLPDKPVCAYFKHDFNINCGWARTWGGSGWDRSIGIAVDDDGNAYIVGQFKSTVDFDPGPGIDQHTSLGDEDIYLCKFDSSGNFLWARTWGNPDHYELGSGVGIDGNGSAYVAGHFSGTTDFNPGPGVDEHTATAIIDVFLSKFDVNGDFQWCRTWGGSGFDVAGGVAVSGSGDIYVSGKFHYVVDFDPGTGVDEHTSNGAYDIFLSKFNANGVLQWANTWGGCYSEEAHEVTVDSSGNIYVTGDFSDTVDFDPGPGVDEHTSNFGHCEFLSKFDVNGNYQWVRIWDEDFAQSIDIAVNGIGSIYLTGIFEATIDFDPGPGVDEHTSNGYWDAFLSKLDAAGNFQWCRTWGGQFYDVGYGVAIDGDNDVYIIGFYEYTVDFDPGPEVDEHISHSNSEDVFLSKFDPMGGFIWCRTWGGDKHEEGRGVGIDCGGNAYVTGTFKDTVDFNPGPGVDEHISSGFTDVFLSRIPPDGNW